MAKKCNEETILKRLMTIQKIHSDIKSKNDTSKYKTIDQLAYMLWQKPHTRNSDITLAIEFYKQFYPEYVSENTIKLRDFFSIPKMYDIQRTRAEIQNTEGLFPAKTSVKRNRTKKEAEYRLYYQKKDKQPVETLPEYYLYLDESGKNDKYFVLAGILLNGESNNHALFIHFNGIKNELCAKYKIKIEELKFTDICTRNLNFYKELVDMWFAEVPPMSFVSIIVENRGLKQSSRKKKTKALLTLLLQKKLAFLIVHATCCSSFASQKAQIEIIVDIDSNEYDVLEKEQLIQDISDKLSSKYIEFLKLNDIIDVNSKDNIFIQLADLYASSLNNIFSNVQDSSETAKCKKEFAKYLLQHVGITKITDERQTPKAKIRYINKFINNATVKDSE